jgi:hypothetical protein
MRRNAERFSEPTHYSLIRGFTTLTRIFVTLGVIDSERKEFWRFFTQALFKHRKRVADSLRHAVVGYHFRKLSEAYGSG